MIAFPCPKCGATLKAPEEKVGARSKCRYCAAAVQVPGSTPSKGPAVSPFRRPTFSAPNNPYNTPIVRFGMYFFSMMSIGFAPVAGYFCVLRFIEASDSANWPTADGVIKAASVEEKKLPRNKTSYTARLKYQYRVGDRDYTGSEISKHDVGSGTRSPAQDIVDRYPINSQHRIYYDPQDPARAVLEPGLTLRAYLFVLIPVVMLIFGAGLILGARAMKRAREAQRIVSQPRRDRR